MRTLRLPLPALTGLLVLTLLGPAAAVAQGATPVLASGELKVVERREVRIEGGWPLALAPDGRWLAVWRYAEDDASNAICAYDAITLAEHRCAPTTARSVDPGTVAWASDSTRLAFTESLVHGDEPDLWVFDASAGAATNLTDDGVDRLLFEDDGAVGDLAPAWSPDGTQLAFSRSVREETALYRVSVVGREAERIASVGPDEGYAVWAGVPG